jgi:hypothetical protein
VKYLKEGKIMYKKLLINSLLAGFSVLQINAAKIPQIVTETRALWHKEIQGINLASGKKIIFSKTPTYYLTKKGGTDIMDLTDGILSSRKDDTIWFDSKTVGWYNDNIVNGTNLLIDLGKVCPVNKVVIRCLAGKSQGSLVSPSSFKLFLSKDGKSFYPAASLLQVQAGEKSQSDLRNYFYIEENGTPYVYPFVLEANADARYIGLKITGASDAVFSDELAVIKATDKELNNKNYNNAYSKKEQAFYTKGIIIKPRIGELIIGSNVNPPNFFIIEDMRSKTESKKTAKVIVELPKQIEITRPAKATKQTCVVGGEEYIRWTLLAKKLRNRHCIEPIYFNIKGKVKEGLPAIIYADCPGVPTIKSSVPIRIVTFPEVNPSFKRLSINLTWMGLRNGGNWRGFFKDWKNLGFTSVDCFPRYWSNKTEAKQKRLAEARSNGLKIVMNESPFHMMAKGHKPGEELFSQIPGKKNSNLCPSYRGRFYAKEMERVSENIRKSKPDYVFWDIECWYNGGREAKSCTRCKAGQQASGKPMNEFLKDKITESFIDLRKAVKKGSAGNKMPIIGSYNHHAAKPVHHHIVDFNRVYPKYIDMAQPSLYVAGRVKDIHNSVRKNYKILKKKVIIPWLSAGTYGEYPPYKLEQMILEALLNGANGITYYCFEDFDTPLDFYYHAKALAEIAPYEDLIMDGEVLEPTGSNKQLTYSGIKKGNEMLLLVGNYANSPSKTTYKTLFRKVKEVKDLRSGKRLTAATTINLEVPKGGIRLLYIRGK